LPTEKPIQQLWLLWQIRILRATPAQLCDALGACTELNLVYRRLLKMFLEELQLIDQQVGQLDKEMATLLSQHQAAVERLAEVPGLGVDSAQQIIAEVGAKAATFASAKHLSSWVGACPGDEESAGVSTSHRSPRATAKCGAFSINAPTLRSGRKEASSRSRIAASPPRPFAAQIATLF
jgi:transposase